MLTSFMMSVVDLVIRRCIVGLKGLISHVLVVHTLLVVTDLRNLTWL